MTTPTTPAQSCALASFSIDGINAHEIVRTLDVDFGIFTVVRKLKDRTVVRVTPNLYNSTDDLDRLLEAIDALARS
jgi:selenocysteine lyase/cysteine desulfurase